MSPKNFVPVLNYAGTGRRKYQYEGDDRQYDKGRKGCSSHVDLLLLVVLLTIKQKACLNCFFRLLFRRLNGITCKPARGPTGIIFLSGSILS